MRTQCRSAGLSPTDREVLRRRIARLERGQQTATSPSSAPLGAAEIDARLPGGGLPRGCLHEVAGDLAGAATGFGLLLLARLAGSAPPHGAPGPVVWCLPDIDLYGPGLAGCGLEPDRLVLVRARSRVARLWAMEEALRCPGVQAVVGELGAREQMDLIASRRLQLAAESSGVTGIVLRACNIAALTAAQDATARLGASVAATRWLVSAVPADPAAGAALAIGSAARWRLQLVRCRGGRCGDWIVETDHATRDLAVSAPLRDRTVAAEGATSLRRVG